jgi:beta-galactosidase
MAPMNPLSRRQFGGAVAALAAGSSGAAAQAAGGGSEEEDRQSLDGVWEFRLDREPAWTLVEVPHTWQIASGSAGYLGVAWYRRTFEAPSGWAGRTVRAEFEAVYHTASVTLNGKPVGEHKGKGYTAFTVDLTGELKPGAANTLVVRVDNSFDEEMLPRGSSFDWTPDGGIIRPVTLIATPRLFIDRLEVDADPILTEDAARVDVRAVVRNTGTAARQVFAAFAVTEEATGRTVLRGRTKAAATVRPGNSEEIALPPARLEKPRLWHFDHPHLYRLRVWIESAGRRQHSSATTFGIRKIEAREGGIYLNGERVWLMGVERMGGSHPRYGMAEPASLIAHDHAEMKELNCVLTRVHWQQDRRVLDYCDRHGILIQVEVPSWGGHTFEGMRDKPAAAILENGLEQLREMIRRDRNHPCVFSWGLCNEVNGQNPPAYAFVERMYQEAKKLDPRRLATYASNSLERTPAKDAARLMDVIFWNEYYESWYKGGLPELRRNLEELGAAFPGKPVVVSEYGLCECRPEHTGGDPARIRILREHTGVYREFDFVAGAIFFCYNDYRTHIGDKGLGVMKQRVHGVVDLYGRRKPSFDALRREASPVEALEVAAEGAILVATLKLRRRVPAYVLKGYRLRWIVYANGNLPMEQREIPLPQLKPGEERRVTLDFQQASPQAVQVDLMRPTGFSAAGATWKA